jgi:hypothetical protein
VDTGRADTAAALPWDGGVRADDLRAAVRSLVDTVSVEVLDDPALWGRPVRDERYALLAQAPQTQVASHIRACHCE